MFIKLSIMYRILKMLNDYGMWSEGARIISAKRLQQRDVS